MWKIKFSYKKQMKRVGVGPKVDPANSNKRKEVVLKWKKEK